MSQILTMKQALIELCYRVKDDTPETIRQKLKNGSDKRMKYLTLIVRRYHKSLTIAPKYGLIGVGAITFAEQRSEEFQRRAIKITERTAS